MDTTEALINSPLSPQITGDFNIIKLLGKGGMGEVYLAEQVGVGCRRVALKVLNRSCSDNPDLARRFVNEAASAGRINHRNVVLIYESRATEDGQLYVAMEYVEGKDLRERIEEHGTLPLDKIVDITRQICAGLGAAHKLGIVHRDVKPDNIMLARDDDGAEVVKVLDFGIARLSETGDSASHTKSGIVMGTPHYMSPEQALGNTGDKIDSRSDIYSLGMVVYQMLCGRVAFQSDSWMQIMYKHISEQPVPPSQLRPGLAYLRQIEPVVLRALEKDREKRQQTTAEFAREMEAAFEQFKAGGMDATVAADYRSPGLAQGLPFSRTDATVGPGQPAASPTPFGSPAAANAFSAGKPSEQVAPASPTAAGTRPVSPAKRWLLAITALVILIGVGALLVLKPWGSGNRQPATHRMRRNLMPATHSHSFTALTLDKNGEVVAQHRGETRAFTEDLGNGVGLDMLAIPGGTFEMGASPPEAADHPNELPRHEVTVPAFYMGRFEITEAEWNAVAKLPQVKRGLKPDPSPFKGNPKLPVQDVSWYDAEEFCARLSNASGRTYRLPTEAEWEYACRAGTDTPFNTGETITADTVDYDAKYPYGSSPKGTALKQPVPVGSLNAANGFGLTEMHGNMAEWCLDGWHDNYQGAPTDGSEWISGAEPDSRVYRGGSWTSGGDDCRSASRHKYDPDIATTFVGFRVVMVPSKK